MNFLLRLSHLTGVLSAELTELDTGERIFGLDAQLLQDTVILALSVILLFFLLSYFLFNPARELIKKRQDKIAGEMEFAKQEKADAVSMKADYQAKLQSVDKEAEEILSEARKKAMKREAEIVDNAKEEAVRIQKRAEKEIELEKRKVRDEVKQEMISVATAMAGKIVAVSIDNNKQAELINDTLKEMGDETWQS